jgi:hypothetical protein
MMFLGEGILFVTAMNGISILIFYKKARIYAKKIYAGHSTKQMASSYAVGGQQQE